MNKIDGLNEKEHIEIYSIVQERSKNDDRTRYSLSEVKEKIDSQNQKIKGDVFYEI